MHGNQVTAPSWPLCPSCHRPMGDGMLMKPLALVDPSLPPLPADREALEAPERRVAVPSAGSSLRVPGNRGR